MDSITIKITDTIKYTLTFQVDKQSFIGNCEAKRIDYFDGVFDGSINNVISIETRFVFAMEKVIRSIAGNYTKTRSNPRKLAKRIHSLCSLGMDPSNEFAELIKCDGIDPDTYQIISELKCNLSNELYIKFLATKLPADYDLSGFRRDLLKAMFDHTKHNLLVLHSRNVIYIYDLIKHNRSTNILEDLGLTKVDSVIIGHRLNLCAIKVSSKIIFYHLIQRHIVAEFAIDPKSDAGSIDSFCFASTTDTFYVSRSTGIVEVYSIDGSGKFDVVGSHELGRRAFALSLSPDDRFLAFVTKIANSANHVFALYLATGMTLSRLSKTDKVAFLDNDRWVYYSDYRLDEGIKVRTQCGEYNEFNSNVFKGRAITCPERDLFVCYYPKCANRNHNAIVFGGSRVAREIEQNECWQSPDVLGTTCEGKEYVHRFNSSGGTGIYFIQKYISTAYKQFTHTSNCFSHNTKNIYTVMHDGKGHYQIAKYRIADTGDINKKFVVPIQFESDPKDLEIANVQWCDPVLAERIKSFI